MDNTISVIIPTYEEDDYLCRCINSIVKQTVKPIEIIIADQDVYTRYEKYDNVYCISGNNELIPVEEDIHYKKEKKQDIEVFEEEKRIAENVTKALKLAHGNLIFFCNITSILERNVLETLIYNINSRNMNSIKCMYYKDEKYLDFYETDMIWGKLYIKELLLQNLLEKWNYLEVSKWIHDIQIQYNNINFIDDVVIFDENIKSIIQKFYIVKLKNNIEKYLEFFENRLNNNIDLFENISTYDYIKVKIVSTIIKNKIEDPNLVFELAEKYILPIYNNRINAKPHRKELLRRELINFFEKVKRDKLQFNAILVLFDLDEKKYNLFCKYDIDKFSKISKMAKNEKNSEKRKPFLKILNRKEI